jgi:hypothetical protein
MKKYFTILTVVLIGINYGCNNSVKEENSEVSATQPSITVKEPEHQHSESDSIELNNGAKWKIVPEMMVILEIWNQILIVLLKQNIQN